MDYASPLCVALTLGLGAVPAFAEPTGPEGLGILIDAGYTYDSNVTRAFDSSDVRRDSAFNVNVSKNFAIPLSEHMRLTINGRVGADTFLEFDGLDRLYAGVEAEMLFRASGDYSTPTFGFFGSVEDDEYESYLRKGYRYSAGVTIRQPVTDRINAFGALASERRHGENTVFDTENSYLRMNLDYALERNGALYVACEYRTGDIVSTGQPWVKATNVSTVWIRDDVFSSSTPFYDYRMRGKTALLSLGYNLPLKGKNALDISWSGVRSVPDLQPGYAFGEIRYFDNQVSVVFLAAF